MLSHNNQKTKEIFKNIENKLNIKNVAISGLLVVSISLFGCSDNIECSIAKKHAHLYKSSKSFDRYIVSESAKEKYLERTDSFMVTNEDIEKLLKFEQENNLFKIYLNEEKINEVLEKHKSYTEYGYKYNNLLPRSNIEKVENIIMVSDIHMPKIGFSLTSETEGYNFNEEARNVKYVYYAYKVEEDENGNLNLIRSEEVDNFEELPKEYSYIKEDFYKIVNCKTKDDLGYEDDQVVKIQEENINVDELFVDKQRKVLVRTKGAI